MSEGKSVVRYEENAKQATVTGWACATCGRFHGSGERSEHHARWCCATDLPCDGCGERIEKHYALCGKCRQKKDDAKWFKALEAAVEWDGETPLALARDGDRFFFSPDDIGDYLADHDSPNDVRLVLCRPENGPYFDMVEYLCDVLPDDDHGGHSLVTDEIDKTVNDWIAQHAPFSWWATGQAVTVASVLKVCEGVVG